MAYSDAFNRVLSCIPMSGETQIRWENLEKTKLGPLFGMMSAVEQNPEYHAEGNVYIHTRCVCEELIKLEEYRNGTAQDKTVLFLAALLHDIGKIACTKIEDGAIVSPYHSSKGALMARELLWREFGLCGSEEKQQLREAVCLLVRYHGFPPYVIYEKNPEYKILRVACVGSVAGAFSLKKLGVLCMADAFGRKCAGENTYPEAVEYYTQAVEALGCADAPYPFSSDYSQRAYFAKKTAWRDQELFNSTWGRVIMLSGLPGTGKDTWIARNCPDLPVISLDEIRRELNVSPVEPQGKVINLAQNRARALLGKKQPFVLNMTNLTEEIRSKWISLVELYGAGVETVFLETEWEEELRRNANRNAVVPQSVIKGMLSRLEIPKPFECEKVRWVIT